MQSTNHNFTRFLTRYYFRRRKHRASVGGLWEEIGNLQFSFLVGRGLQPHQRLLDIGCGALRGGVHFVRYLDPGNYYGADLNPTLIEAGRYELEQAGLTSREPHLLVTDRFELSRFGVQFDYALAVSLFTHLPMNQIIRCLVEVAKVIKPQGVFFATFFEAPHPAHLHEITHEKFLSEPCGITTRFDSNPFHYSFQELDWMGRFAGLKTDLIGRWNHPRDQRMAAFALL